MNHAPSSFSSRMPRRILLALALSSAIATPFAASAGSFQLPTTDAAGWGRAFAGGSLYPNDPLATYNNPAALAFITAPSLSATATAIRPSAKFNGSFTTPNGTAVTGGNPDGFGKALAFPSLAYAMPITDRLGLGASLTVPYGLTSEYSPTWQGRYFGSKTHLQSVALTLGAGFKVNDNFSVGIGLIGQQTKAQLNNLIDTASAANAILGAPLFTPQSMDNQLNVNVKRNFSFGYVAGVEIKPTDKDSFGLSYHSKIKNTLSGTYDLYGSSTGITLLGLASQLNPSVPPLSADGGRISAQLDIPAFANLDWVHIYNEKFSLGASFKWTDWSSFRELTPVIQGKELLTLHQDYKDSIIVSVGGEYHFNPVWTLRGGLAYDQTPTQTPTRDPRIPDGTRRIVALGVGYAPTDHWAFDLGYQHQFVKDARVDQVNPALLGGTSMVGYFDDSGDALSLTGTYRF